MDKQEFRKKFGNAIRKLRTQKGWSQEDLAGYLGWDRAYISMIETGKRGIIHDEVMRLLNVLLDDKYRRDLFVDFLEILADPRMQQDLGAIETLIKKAHSTRE